MDKVANIIYREMRSVMGGGEEVGLEPGLELEPGRESTGQFVIIIGRLGREGTGGNPDEGRRWGE